MPTTASHLSDLAISVPASTRLFHKYRLDYCCGGRRSLAEACAEHGGLDADAVLAEIEAAATPDTTPIAGLGVAELAAHVVDRYHARLREDLPRLTGMASKVERVHADKDGCPRGLAEHLASWGDAVLEHLDKEEQVLFPALERADAEVVTALMREHDDHAAALRRTRGLTTDLVPPAAACTTWRALYAGLDEVERDLMEHVHIENHVLFPRALTR